MKYVYIYRDPVSNVVRYVGSGSRKRMGQHTKPSQLALGGEWPFRKWLIEQGDVDWSKHREVLCGPLEPEDALAMEAELIRGHSDTVLNKRCPVTLKYLKPMKITPREPYGPRSESGRAKAYRDERRGRSGSPTSSKSGGGVGKHGNGWRATFRHEGVVIRKGFPTYCEALKWRLAREQEHWGGG